MELVNQVHVSPVHNLEKHDETDSYINTLWAHLHSRDSHSIIFAKALGLGEPTSSVSLFINCMIYKYITPEFFKNMYILATNSTMG